MVFRASCRRIRHSTFHRRASYRLSNLYRRTRVAHFRAPPLPLDREIGMLGHAHSRMAPVARPLALSQRPTSGAALAYLELRPNEHRECLQRVGLDSPWGVSSARCSNSESTFEGDIGGSGLWYSPARSPHRCGVHLHPEVLLITFFFLMHLGIALLLGILVRGRRRDDRHIHDSVLVHNSRRSKSTPLSSENSAAASWWLIHHPRFHLHFTRSQRRG
jgi:hypothetical protein